MSKQEIRSEALRTKLLAFTDGNPNLVYYAYHLNNFRYAEEIVSYFLVRGLKGSAFLAWVKDKHRGSVLSAAKEAVAAINKTHVKPILIGRDYLGRTI